MLKDCKLIKALSLIGKDKYMHFTVCLVLTLVLFVIGMVCGLSLYATIPAFVIPMILGVVKEFIDKKETGLFDHYDIVADFLGSFLGTVLIALLSIVI